MNTQRVVPRPVPKGTLLDKHSQDVAYVDCFEMVVTNARKTIRQPKKHRSVTLAQSFAESFFGSRRFVPESCVLWFVRWLFYRPPPCQLSYGQGFFRVVKESEDEILMDAGPTQSWLRVLEDPEALQRTYQFGSIIKKPSLWLGLLVYPHVWYAKFLLAGAVHHHMCPDR